MASAFTTIVTILLGLVLCNSLYGLYKLFVIPPCEPGWTCLEYYLKSNPDLQLLVFTSESKMAQYSNDAIYLGRVRNFNYSHEMEKPLKIDLPPKTRDNGTLYIHVYLVPKSNSETRVKYLRNTALSHFVYPLTEYALPSDDGFDLLSGGKDKIYVYRPVTHFKKIVGFKMLTGINELPRHLLPTELEGFARVDASNRLLPIMHYDALSDLMSNLVPLHNETSIDVILKYTPIGVGKFRFMIAAEMSIKAVEDYGVSKKEIDQLKGLFSDGNKIYLLCITLVIACLHILLDILALKNDVSFWRTRKTLAGLSKKTVMWRAFSQTVIFLFLFEENTSLLISVPLFFCVLIEMWKVIKVLRFDVKTLATSKKQMSEAEKDTDAIDNEGMRYLLYILFPLCVGGAIYSLLYNHHKSWYSWTITSLVNGVYAFGFLFMLPQLFINYKMKSVAQLPWRFFMYKAFNTFVDDIFAFIIEMPTAHRIACFRDDIVFLIYLYQRWLYPVDKNRIETSSSVDETVDDIQTTVRRSKKRN